MLGTSTGPPTPDNVGDLVLSVRKAIEPDASTLAILENQRGVGYKLHTAPTDRRCQPSSNSCAIKSMGTARFCSIDRPDWKIAP